VTEQAGATQVEVRAEDLDDLDALYAELRGITGITVEMTPAQAERGDQGTVVDLITVALTSGAVTAFLQIVKALTESRGPGFRLRIQNGRKKIEIDARDPDQGLDALRDLLDDS
jgi:hypothetical protein